MRKFRVECNFGCRYFEELSKAKKYFEKCERNSLKAELWLVHYNYCLLLGSYPTKQELLAITRAI